MRAQGQLFHVLPQQELEGASTSRARYVHLVGTGQLTAGEDVDKWDYNSVPYA